MKASFAERAGLDTGWGATPTTAGTSTQRPLACASALLLSYLCCVSFHAAALQSSSSVIVRGNPSLPAGERSQPPDPA